MKKIIKFIVLVFVVGISACGRVGELERVKFEQVIAPELDILPHNSK